MTTAQLIVTGLIAAYLVAMPLAILANRATHIARALQRAALAAEAIQDMYVHAGYGVPPEDDSLDGPHVPLAPDAGAPA